MSSQPFHEEALKLIGMEPSPDPVALEALGVREQQLGLRFPASFAEWYGGRRGIELLARYSNCDQPIAIEKLGAPHVLMPGRDPLGEGVLPFMIENQGVCVWGLRLDGTADPAVLVAVDPDYLWRPHSEDHPQDDPILLQAQDVPLRPADLGFLRQRFAERAITHGWPGRDQYRFQAEQSRILIWDGDWQADWLIWAADESALHETLRALAKCGHLEETLFSIDDAGERVLARFRAK